MVIQDVRGRYRSDGVFDPYRQEPTDGYDSVEWVAGLPYCNGKVGMSGLSYPGAVQWLAAGQAPPHLEAIVPAMCFSNSRHFFFTGEPNIRHGEDGFAAFVLNCFCDFSTAGLVAAGLEYFGSFLCEEAGCGAAYSRSSSRN